VVTPDGHSYDVLFVGTTEGRVLKIVNTADPTNAQPTQRPTLIEEMVVLKPGTRVEKLRVIRNSMDAAPKLVIMTSTSVLSVPLARCDAAKSCRSCVALQDPYCAWDVRRELCTSLHENSKMDSSNYLQNVLTGKHSDCGNMGGGAAESSYTQTSDEEPKSRVLVDITPDDVDDEADNLFGDIADGANHVHRHHHPDSHYSTEELSMAVATSCVCALIIGFVTGFLMSRRCSCSSRELADENPYHVPYLNQ
jgi:semaphorin 6